MGLDTFNKRSRPALFQQLATEKYDLLVVGGGITGASIFRDAALRKLAVALVEASDFAVGTSSRSSGLIHGGFRYLRSLDFAVTWESCHERDLQIRLNRRLIRPEPILIPIYGRTRPTLGLGMLVYEAMSGFKSPGWHQRLHRQETLRMAPGLCRDGLLGSYRYYEAVVNDYRLTLERSDQCPGGQDDHRQAHGPQGC